MAKRKSSYHTQRVTNQPLLFSLTYGLVNAGVVSEEDYQRALRNGATHVTPSGSFVTRSTR